MDEDGDEKHRFPLGNLRFMYECYLGGEATLVFVLPLEKGRSSGVTTFEFRVYTIPTRKVGDLADG